MSDLIKRFQITDSFFGRYQELVRDTVLPFQEGILRDQVPDAAKSHAIENFRLAAELVKTGVKSGDFYGMVFQDSDVAKWLEAASYILMLKGDSELEARCDSIIETIAQAQYPDGYLNTFFTLKEPDRKWTDLAEAHELYCAGHMMEAAVAYFDATGKDTLLQVMSRMADHIYDLFITKGKEGYPGHPEIELALMKMYHCTGKKKYRELAQHFIDVRGVDSDYFHKENETRGWYVWNPNQAEKQYAQNHLPVREQDQAVGHAVRGVYLYTGMASLAAETQDETLVASCKRLWKNITQSRMYLTGAIGSAYEGEAFTEDYHLPNDTAYGETCAAIGLLFFARKMLDLEVHATYGDVMERALYNCVLAGMQLDGKRFFYVNPLEVLPGISGVAATHHHVLPLRPKWFGCACCPPNVARLLPSLGDYAWIEKDRKVYSNLYIGGVFRTRESIGGAIHTTTQYPYEGRVRYQFHPDSEKMEMTFAIRVPEWSNQTTFTRNGVAVEPEIHQGFAYLEGPFSEGEEILMQLDMGLNKIYCNPKVSANSGKVAFMKGPLVYCAEGVDNQEDVLGLMVNSMSDLHPEEYRPEGLEGVVGIILEGRRRLPMEELYCRKEPDVMPTKIRLIPYYTWGNRGLNQMRVWIPEES